MGLDWMLNKMKAKDGHQAEFDELNKKLNDNISGEEEKQIEARLDQISTSVYEVLGAPRVGDNETTRAWFREHTYEPAQKEVEAEKTRRSFPHTRFIAHWDRPFETLLAENAGKYILELAPDQEDIAAVSGMLTSNLDFRGKIIGRSPVLSEDLQNQAYEDHTAEEAVAYAESLAERLEVYKTEICPDWETAQFGNGGPIRDAIADVENAIKWLSYWGSRGFGFHAWY